MISFIPIDGINKINKGDDLPEIIIEASKEHFPLLSNDVFVIASKVVAKVQGRTIQLDQNTTKQDIVKTESKRIIRQRGDLIISETKHGFICANAGIDESNVEDGSIVLLPSDVDSSAHGLRMAMANITGVDCAVIISDTFGRPFRMGETNVALGYSGIKSFADLVGKTDFYGRELKATTIAIPDEIASAAELVMHKDAGICAVLVRGLPESYKGNGKGSDLIRHHSQDLFR